MSVSVSHKETTTTTHDDGESMMIGIRDMGNHYNPIFLNNHWCGNRLTILRRCVLKNCQMKSALCSTTAYKYLLKMRNV
ncbi:CLUMA_CG000510, isoform A [Clunio marinus]|uniref:CLUMA_CG000510, isoform A n=1 Tax=Clunio marinus TaxID=568069 RepID=A0A1J1HF91_9DIPT|nr:CLUMA_CG000510, isoform A [Clunio marinus]